MRDRSQPIAIDANFEILEETSDWLAINKHAPLLVHPTSDTEEPTLWHGLKALLLYELTNGGHVALINRLDRETSGITLVSKTKEAVSRLGKLMQQRGFQKEYIAFCFGHPQKNEFRIEGNIIRQGEITKSNVWIKQTIHPEGKPCLTEIEVLGRYIHSPSQRSFSVVRCLPHTGRLHQIRVHLSSIQHPLIGDKIYGESENFYLEHIEKGWTSYLEKHLLLKRQALHASKLSFDDMGHSYTIEAPLPPDMQYFLNQSILI